MVITTVGDGQQRIEIQENLSPLSIESNIMNIDTFEKLLREVLSEIFKKLTVPYDLIAAGRCCKNWNRPLA